MIFWYESRGKREGERMADIMQGSFLTRAEGDDSELAYVKFNSGTSKRMRHAKKRCLDDAQKWRKSLHRFPTEEEWQKNPQMFTLDTVEDLFGSFDEMIDELKAKNKPSQTWKPKIKTSRKPKSERKEGATMGRKQEYTDQELAKILHSACEGKAYIDQLQYKHWYSRQTERTPTPDTIARRLGGGRWNSQLFDRMRGLLELESETETVVPAPTEPEPELEPENSAPEPEPAVAESIEPPTTELSVEPSMNPADLPGHCLVNLLGRDCRLCYDGPYIKSPKGNPSIVAKVKKVYSIDDRGNCNETSQWKLIIKQPDCEIELPEPKPDIIYLVDARIYEVIPAKHRRKDLLPVYRSKGNESNPPGLYVVRRTNTTSRA